MKIEMQVKFNVFGLDFKADIAYYSGTPARLSGRPENADMGEPPEVEFFSLTTGEEIIHDVMVLLDSDELFDKFAEAAGCAAELEIYGEPQNV